MTCGKPGRCGPGPPRRRPRRSPSARAGRRCPGTRRSGWRSVTVTERRASAAVWQDGERAHGRAGASTASGSPPGSSASSSRSRRPVAAMKTSSRLGSFQVEAGDRDAGLVEGAHHVGDRRGPRAQARGDGPRGAAAGGHQRPERRQQGRRHGSLGRVGDDDRQRRVAHPGLQLARGALGHQPATVDDADPRRPSWSASSRYWVVRKTVVPASVVEPAHLVPDGWPGGDRVQARRRLVQEEHDGRVDEGHGEVQATAHAARVGAHLSVGGLGQPHPGPAAQRARLRPAAPLSPCSTPCRRTTRARSCSRSSAASWRARPIERRTPPRLPRRRGPPRAPARGSAAAAWRRS